MPSIDVLRVIPSRLDPPPVDAPPQAASPSVQFLTIREAAGLLRVSESTVRNAIRAGQLRAFRFGLRGGSIRLSPTDLEAYMAACATEADRVQIAPRRPCGGAFQNLNAAKLLAAWRRQGVLPDRPSDNNAPSSGCSYDP